MIVRFLILAVCVAITGCATEINYKNAQKYYEVGLSAEAVRNWSGAHEAFRRSLINARSAGAPQAFVSAATYNLGRMAGYICDYAQAEKLLLESLALERGLKMPDPGNITKRLSELARLYQDQGRFREAAAFYAQAVPELDRLGVSERDPIGYARYLEDYAESLAASGQVAEVVPIAARASELRTKHVTREASFTPIRYKEICGKAP
jgi:tetratricopeptide (TPR) repeat protein